MSSFSQRKGLEPVSKIIQVDSMDESLRIAIWNTLDRCFWSRSGFLDECSAMHKVHMQRFSALLWENFFRLRLDSRPLSMAARMLYIEEWFFAAAWNKVYDFIEFIIQREVMPFSDLSKPLKADAAARQRMEGREQGVDQRHRQKLRAVRLDR
jgi:hypothetical protein